MVFPKKAWDLSSASSLKSVQEALVTAYRAGDRTVRDWVAGYAPRICRDLGLPSPDNDGIMEIVSPSLPLAISCWLWVVFLAALGCSFLAVWAALGALGSDLV